MAADIFNGLTGQRAVKERLGAFVWGMAPDQALMLTGPAGMGKRSFARAYANALLCTGNTAGAAGTGDAAGRQLDAGGQRFDAAGEPFNAAGRPCGLCAPCRLFASGALDDYLYIEPSGQGQNPVISVDAIRKLINWLAIRPFHSKKKVYILGQADHMTEQAQNALLKTLEEPPEYGAAVLTVENPGAMLETVLSRCTVIRFAEYTDDELALILRGVSAQVYGPANDSAVRQLIRLSGGNPGRAFELAKSGGFFSQRSEIIGLFCGHIEGDARATYMLAAFLERNREQFARFSGLLIDWLRDIWIYSMPEALQSSSRIINGDMEHKLCSYIGRFRPDALLDSIERIDEAAAAISANANFTLAVNSMIFKIGDLLSNS